jgi:acetolactate decarboxylase
VPSPRVARFGGALLLLATSRCASGPRVHAPPKVEHAGAMRELFDSGSAAARVVLSSVLEKPHAYALGPLEGLRGEILVWDGTPFTSRVESGSVRVTVDADAKAPLLAWSHVKEWRGADVPDDALALAALEAWLPQNAAKLGLDPDAPFAFRILGAVDHATLHVDDLPPGSRVTHELHDASAKKVELAHVPVQALGFFAPDSAGATGVWLHKGSQSSHDSRLHVHLRTTLGATMGHVDDLTLTSGARVEFAWR